MCHRGDRVHRTFEGAVEVVQNHVDPYRLEGQPSSFSLEKVLSIDLERDDIAETGMGSAGEWDADDQGNIYVVCFKNKENFIYRFDPAGGLTTSFGRRGQGPGELQWPFLGGVSDKNEISLVDYGQKFVVYDTKGRLLREVKLKRHALHIDALSNGKFLTFGSRPELFSARTYVDALVLCGSNFEEIKILDRYENAIDNSRQVPCFMWRVSGDRIFVVNQARGYEIWVFDLEGNLVRKIRKECRPVRVTDEIKDAILGPEERRAGIPQDKYFPDPLPPLNQFFADDEGRIFVMTYEPGPNPGEYLWDIFNPEGVFVGRKALNIVWATLYLGPRYTFVRKGLLYCHKEKESGFQELVVSRMIWK
ncbi:MAG TPA: 6-bladed beta-propeller [Candidatus Aminicenantes bacterium]|nr:6-bladed beta-propeller [Candidatus Aminicenantes bacterium]